MSDRSYSMHHRGVNLDGKAAAKAAVAEADKAGGRISAFFCESILSCGGQVVLPAGYLQDVYDVMHQEGAVCIADEASCFPAEEHILSLPACQSQILLGPQHAQYDAMRLVTYL